MAAPQINITLGTAGHIDHGKTALVKSLTGCETDRLKEEQERGMSIDLGYAPCTVADMEVGIVDVPGHEGFVKTMVAGASGMDGVILVVAADDGIMPQTREHLEILTLLGLRHGMVALTKIDRATPDRAAEVRVALAGLLSGTFLEGAPVVGVSNVTAEGFDEFYERLWTLVRGIRPKRLDGVFRLPLDRAFSAQGFGTVIAGIPVAGEAAVGDEVVLLPQQSKGQLRRIEVYGRNSGTARAGQCVAINVGHWDPRQINRGDVVATPDYFAPRQWFVCDLQMLAHERLTVKSGAHLMFHTGTSAVPAAIYPLSGDRLCAGDRHLVQIRTQRPIVAGPGDYFIARTPSPVRTIGGGTILEPLAQRIRRNRPDLLDEVRAQAAAVGDEVRWVEHCLKTADGWAAAAADLAVRAKLLRRRTEEILAQLVIERKAAALGHALYMHVDTAAKAKARILAALLAFHAQSPDSPGPASDQLRQAAGLEKPLADALLAQLKSEGRVVETAGRLAVAEHRARFRGDDAEQIEAIEARFRQQAMNPPTAAELADAMRLNGPTIDRLLKLLHEHGRLVRVAEDLLFHREAIDRARELLVAHLRKEGQLESVKFKYLLDTSRKFAIPLLDYFDRTGVTRRVGYTRYLKAPPPGPGHGS
jgi:selenocysteine-specific elongation factor